MTLAPWWAEVELDPEFETSTTTASQLSALEQTQKLVRRPVRGLQMKREVFAVLSVTGPSNVALKNASAPKDQPVSYTSNFLLQAIQEERVEKMQLISTFGAPRGFFFGEQPRSISCSAILLNSADFQWEAEWWENYENSLRGTRLVDKGMKAVLTYEDRVVEGYLFRASTSKSEPTPQVVNLSFSMWVTAALDLIKVGEPKIDNFHLDRNQMALDYGEFEPDTVAVPEVLNEVRARNIRSLNAGGGLFGAIRAGATDYLSSFTGSTRQSIDAVREDWLYGRNVVVPQGFAGSTGATRNTAFAEGPGAVVISTDGQRLTVKEGTRVNIKVPEPVVLKTPVGEFYRDNPDEYMARQQDYKPPTFLPTEEDQRETDVELATRMFEEFGIDVSSSADPQKTGDVLRATGRATFGLISLAGMLPRGEDAASLLNGERALRVEDARLQATLEGSR